MAGKFTSGFVTSPQKDNIFLHREEAAGWLTLGRFNLLSLLCGILFIPLCSDVTWPFLFFFPAICAIVDMQPKLFRVEVTCLRIPVGISVVPYLLLLIWTRVSSFQLSYSEDWWYSFHRVYFCSFDRLSFLVRWT